MILILSFCFVGLRHWDSAALQHTNSANLSIKSAICNIGVYYYQGLSTPDQATKLPKSENGNKLLPETATLLPETVSGNVAVFGDYSFANNLLPFSATLLPGVDRP